MPRDSSQTDFADARGARFLAAVSLLPCVLVPAWGAQGPGMVDYETLQAGRFAGPTAVPAEGLAFELDGARWHLRSGQLWLMEPTSTGAVTGLLFEGDGVWEMEVPDPIELRQLRRFAENRELEVLAADFGRLILRVSSPELVPELSAMQASPEASYEHNGFYDERQKQALLHFWTDVDARIIAALRTLGDRYARVDMETEEHGWLTYSYDEMAAEEIEVAKLREGRSYVERWLALDRVQDRRESGRPGSVWTAATKLEHFDARVDLTHAGKGATRGVGAVNPTDARFEVESRFVSERDGMAALMLELHPMAEVSSVWLGGDELQFLRYNVGRMSSSFPNRMHHSDLVVLLEEPLREGDQIELDFVYQLELDNYAPLLSWYPRPRGMGLELHTYRIEATHRKDYGFKATGQFVEERQNEDKTRTAVWAAEEPVDAAAFTLALRPHEQSYTFEGLPEVVMFGTQAGYMSSDKIEGFAADIINPINFYQRLFGTEVSTDLLNVTFIASGHGQAGSGLLHISDSIAQPGQPGFANQGAREAFLAHEVAHEWWGHQVGWADYRHQWLSEGLAEYSAMMFVEASLENGPKLFRKFLEASNDELTGSVASVFGAFGRAGLALDNKAAQDRIGPIGHGYRAGVAEAPAAYSSMAYTKGAMVVHMLRSIMRAVTGTDERFFRMLADFVQTYSGRAVTTEDFAATVTKHAAMDWTWFFDQWVYGTEIPTFKAEHTVEKGPQGKWLIRLDISMTDVSPGFKTLVPVTADFGDGRQGQVVVMVDRPSVQHTVALPSKPKNVIFNPDYSILSKMKGR